MLPALRGATGWLWQRGLCTSRVAVPAALLDRLHDSPARLQMVQRAGRGLVASADIAAGAVVLREEPLLCAAAPEHQGQVCHHCLRVLQPGGPRQRHGALAFCSAACHAGAQAAYLEVEGLPDPAGGYGTLFEALRRHCGQQRERFPLLAARLAAHLLQDAARGRADSQAARQGLNFLNYVNVPPPAPPPWAEAHELLRRGVDAFAQHTRAQHGAGSPVTQRVDAAAERLGLDWFAACMARFSINTFRVDCVWPPSPAGSSTSLAALAAAVIGGQAAGHSGSALYQAASMFNHSCDPAVLVQYPENNAKAVFRAARDIATGEQLCITYINAELPVGTRRAQLEWGYGFACQCTRCIEEQSQCGAEQLTPASLDAL